MLVPHNANVVRSPDEAGWEAYCACRWACPRPHRTQLAARLHGWLHVAWGVI